MACTMHPPVLEKRNLIPAQTISVYVVQMLRLPTTFHQAEHLLLKDNGE